MNEQNLKQWLQASDATASEPAVAPLDADHLERLIADRRTRLRVLVAAGAASVAVAAALLTTLPDRARPTIALTTEGAKTAVPIEEPSALDLEASQARLAALEREVNERRLFVFQLRQAAELDQLNRELRELEASLPTSLDVSIRLDEARNQAAAVSFAYANLLATDFGDDQRAADEYRSIVKLYPNTTWSKAAEQVQYSEAHEL
jgi:hypothetical protein